MSPLNKICFTIEPLQYANSAVIFIVKLRPFPLSGEVTSLIHYFRPGSERFLMTKQYCLKIAICFVLQKLFSKKLGYQWYSGLL